MTNQHQLHIFSCPKIEEYFGPNPLFYFFGKKNFFKINYSKYDMEG